MKSKFAFFKKKNQGKNNYWSSLKISSTWISLVYISRCMNKHCFRVSWLQIEKKTREREKILSLSKTFSQLLFLWQTWTSKAWIFPKDLNEIQNFFFSPFLVKKGYFIKTWERRQRRHEVKKKDEGIFNLFYFSSNKSRKLT